MAKATAGKRTTNKAALKRRTAAASKPLRAKAESAFPAGSKPSKSEVKRIVPRMTRS
jgi:hypothetical protein